MLFALTYIDHIASRTSTALKPARLIILADNDYYSTTSSTTSSGRFAKFGVPLSAANKTGLGSSAALVTALTASLLTHYLPKELYDATSEGGKKILHNLAQAAHCAAQGKVGSGFDVAAAVFGSCLYRRFSPGVLSDIPEPGAAEFVEKLAAAVEGTWDVEVNKDGVAMPRGVVLRMCDVDCGSQTVGMVKNVLKWRSANPEKSTALWDELQGYNTQLAQNLKEHDTAAIPETIQKIRKMIREMSALSEVPIEPASQTALLDGVTSVEGVFGGVVPGAGGFDAAALLMMDDGETEKRVEDFLRKWTDEKDANVRLLNVKGEMAGVRRENLDVYDGWL